MNIVSGLIQALDRVRDGLGVQSADALESAARGLLDDNHALMSLQAGETIDDFGLKDVTGRGVKLSQYLANGPVVLTFYRGGWCLYCQSYLSALQAALPAFRAAGAQLIAVSPQTTEYSMATAEKLQIGFPVLSDQDNALARRFGLVFRLPEAFRQAYSTLDIDLPRHNGSETFELPVPATYIIRPDRVISYAHVDPDYTRRPHPGDILSHLQLLQVGFGEQTPASD